MSGTGPPLLLLSPFAIAASSLNGLRDGLSRRFRVISFDYPGSGTASLPTCPLTIPSLAEMAVGLLDHLGIDAATVCGVSMGGLVAQELALQYPERVNGLVLVSTTAGGPDALRGSLRAVKRKPSEGGVPFHDIRLSGALVQAMAASVHDTSRRLHRIQADTLVIHGERDRIVPPGNARFLGRHIPSSTVRIQPGIGHLLAFRNADKTSDAVLDWWKTADRARGDASVWTRTVRPLAPLGALTLGPPRLYLTALQVTATELTRAATRAAGSS